MKRFAFLIWEIKEKISLQVYSLGAKGERRSQRKQERLCLKVPIDETVRWSLRNESLEEDLCILRVPEEQNQTDAIYHIQFDLKSFFYLNLHKERCTETSRFQVGSSLSFLNLEVSEIFSSIALL